MFSEKAYSAEYAAERQRIREMVEFERYCRDYGLWDEMEKMYREDTKVKISWFEGFGHEFVEQSKKMPGSKHKIYNTVVEVCGNKAAAEIVAQITSRGEIQGMMVDLVSDVKLLYCLEKEGSGWKICSIDCIYEKDNLIPLWEMGDSQGAASVEKCAQKLRKSYMFLDMVLEEKGKAVNGELPGEDRPDTVSGLYEKCRTWLET